MEKLYLSKVLEIAKAQVGYIEKETNAQLDNKTANAGDENFNKYARDFDEKYKKKYYLCFRFYLPKYHVQYWSNLETFDRDMPWSFPPIEWAKFRFKLELAQKYVSKIISFEVPHFMSPDSLYPSAGHLYNKYKAYLQDKLNK